MIPKIIHDKIKYDTLNEKIININKELTYLFYMLYINNLYINNQH